MVTGNVVIFSSIWVVKTLIARPGFHIGSIIALVALFSPSPVTLHVKKTLVVRCQNVKPIRVDPAVTQTLISRVYFHRFVAVQFDDPVVSRES